MGGKFVKGSWALKHSLRSQFAAEKQGGITSLTCDPNIDGCLFLNDIVSLRFVHQSDNFSLNFVHSGGYCHNYREICQLLSETNKFWHLSFTIVNSQYRTKILIRQ
jgi:hypothetical protein